MTTAAVMDDFTGQIDAAVAAGPAWLEPVRREAMARFEALGFPTTRNEDWHYTSAARIAEGGFVLAGASTGNGDSASSGATLTGAAKDYTGATIAKGAAGAAGAKNARAPRPQTSALAAADLAPFQFGRGDWHTLVFENGRYSPQLSNRSTLPTGIRVLELGAALSGDRAFVEARLATVASWRVCSARSR